jgi:hypothetical protein
MIRLQEFQRAYLAALGPARALRLNWQRCRGTVIVQVGIDQHAIVERSGIAIEPVNPGALAVTAVGQRWSVTPLMGDGWSGFQEGVRRL